MPRLKRSISVVELRPPKRTCLRTTAQLNSETCNRDSLSTTSPRSNLKIKRSKTDDLEETGSVEDGDQKTTMNDVPFEILVEILSYLPQIRIFRARPSNPPPQVATVCRKWCAACFEITRHMLLDKVIITRETTERKDQGGEIAWRGWEKRCRVRAKEEQKAENIRKGLLKDGGEAELGLQRPGRIECAILRLKSWTGSKPKLSRRSK